MEPLDLTDLADAFERYLDVVVDPRLAESDRRVDLKHNYFWYPYHAEVLSALAAGRKPVVERRTLTAINAQSQIDHEHLSTSDLLDGITSARTTILALLPQIDPEVQIPYRARTSYPPERFADTLATHLRMHWEHLEPLVARPSAD